jgi:hypothetical protein
MPHTRFANVCPVLIVVLLGVIALRRDVTPAYAAQRFSYEVIRVDEHDIAAKVAQETDAGCEPVAATMWMPSYPAEGVVIFRKPK